MLVETKGDNSTIDLPSLNEEESCETSSSGIKYDKPSFMDRVRDNLKCLERNIVLRHRRYHRRANRERLADFYRTKYNTDAQESLDATQSKEETLSNGKAKGISRLLDFVRNKFTVLPSSRTDNARKRVAIKWRNEKNFSKDDREQKLLLIVGKSIQKEIKVMSIKGLFRAHCVNS